jgi:hypothetical protein
MKGIDLMITKLVGGVAALVALTLVSPALAQTQDGTGSMLPYYYNSDGKKVWGSWGPSSVLSPSQSTSFTHKLYNSAAHDRGTAQIKSRREDQ